MIAEYALNSARDEFTEAEISERSKKVILRAFAGMMIVIGVQSTVLLVIVDGSLT